jgi:hypothetical protein
LVCENLRAGGGAGMGCIGLLQSNTTDRSRRRIADR